MNSYSRREFLGKVGTGMLVSAGGLVIASEFDLLGILHAKESDRLDFGELEPLVSMMQATRAIYKDRAGLLETAKKWMRPVYIKNFEVVEKTYDFFVKERIWAVNNGLPKKTIEWTGEFLKKLNKIKVAVPPPATFVATEVTKAALDKMGEVSPSER